MVQADGGSKKDRKEIARRERSELQRKIAQRRQLRRMSLIGGSVLVVIAVVVVVILTNSGSTTSAPSGTTGGLPGLQTGPAAWQPEYAHMKERLQAIGLPAEPSMSEVLHYHDLLQIFVHGNAVEVPTLVGIDQTAGYLTSLHTHDASGIIHVESPVERSFDLGEFFDVWGVRLTSTCIGGYCNDGSQTLKAFVNGQPFSGDPRTIPLTQHEDIVLAFGTPSELPSPVPSTYSPSISTSCEPSC